MCRGATVGAPGGEIEDAKLLLVARGVDNGAGELQVAILCRLGHPAGRRGIIRTRMVPLLGIVAMQEILPPLNKINSLQADQTGTRVGDRELVGLPEQFDPKIARGGSGTLDQHSNRARTTRAALEGNSGASPCGAAALPGCRKLCCNELHKDAGGGGSHWAGPAAR